MLDSVFFRQRRTDLDKHFGLQLVKPTVEAAHWPTQIMLGEPMRRRDDWIIRIHRRGQRIQRVLAMPSDWILSLVVQQIGNRRFDWLIMQRQWPIDGPRRSIQPALAIRFHDERAIAPERVHAGGILLWLVVGRLFGIEIRIVQAGPFLLLFVPPDISLPLGPGLTFRIGGRAVVHHASIVWPGESPIGTSVVVWITPARARPVAIFLRKNAAIYPTTACSAAVNFQVLEVGDLPTIFDGVTVDLFQNSHDVGFIINSARSSIRENLRCISFVIPRQIQETLIALSLRISVERFELFAEMIDEPRI